MSNEKELSLLVFIDAPGWEILRQRSLPDGLLTIKVPLDTIFGYSSTCAPTIITGKLPREHGHFSFFYYNPTKSPFGICRFLDILPGSVCTPQNVSWLGKLLSGFSDGQVAAVFGRQTPSPDCHPLYVKDTKETFGDGGR